MSWVCLNISERPAWPGWRQFWAVVGDEAREIGSSQVHSLAVHVWPGDFIPSGWEAITGL